MTASKMVVLGGGPAALRASCLAGGALRLVPRGEARRHPELPEDRGVVEASPEGLERVRAVYGAAPEVPDLDLAVRVRGHTLSLPLRRRALPRAFGSEALAPALRGLARARARAALRQIIGGGLEQRCYRDWPVQRFGPGVAEALYLAYGEARFGDPGQVNISAARLHHALGPRAPLVALGGGPEAGAQRLARAAGEALEVDIQGFHVEDGRVRAVLTDQGRVEVEGRLLAAVSPARLATWAAPFLSASARHNMARLRPRHRVQIALRRTDAAAVPAELHVLDRAPFFRVSDPARLPGAAALEGTLIAHLSLAENAPLWRGADAALVDEVVAAFARLGLPGVEARGARVDRLPEHDPAWLGPWHPLHVRSAEVLYDLGLLLVGRAGTHRHVDAAAELEHVDALLREPEQHHEHARVLLDPPVLLDDQRASFTRFVER